ncbi:hypothetical protein [Subtercola lobariae]|uniref:Uncharacterized protein n=1 Tax=Subtercola lobariae TaxID=1588641 RepID=A0A917BCD1_9MICO|nr:hypothetical protein [Subtercola lobariae]GGF33905.1 hypothetical protein GCM10011399_28850 [Subtercola lobariae]
MSEIELSERDVTDLKTFAGILIPGSDSLPTIDRLPAYEGLLRAAVAACGYSDDLIRAAIDLLPINMTWQSIEAYESEYPTSFATLAVLVSASYYMSPRVLAGLSYPVNRRQPARPDEFAEEFATGILDVMLEREPFFRDPLSPEASAHVHHLTSQASDAIYPTTTLLDGKNDD